MVVQERKGDAMTTIIPARFELANIGMPVKKNNRSLTFCCLIPFALSAMRDVGGMNGGGW